MFLFRKNFLTAGAFFLLILLFASGRVSFLRDRLFSSTAYLSSIFSRASFATAGLWGASETWNDERIRLFSDAAELVSLRQENEKLRTVLRLGETTQKKIVSGRIIGIGREIGDEYIIIDKGAEDGIGWDFMVLGGEKLILGKTVEVFARASRVRLLSSPQEVLEVLILPSGVRAVSRGRQSGELLLDLVPRGSNIVVGDAVVTAEQSRYGSGLVIGEVADVRVSDSEVFQKVSARHLFNPFFSTVFVALP